MLETLKFLVAVQVATVWDLDLGSCILVAWNQKSQPVEYCSTAMRT